MTNVFLVTYGGFAKNGKMYVPYKAIVHTADEAIAVINTWQSYGGRNDYASPINVNATTEQKIRKLFRDGLTVNITGGTTRSEVIRTTGCGAWDIIFYPALADTLEEHERIYNEQREAAKQERMRLAEAAKQRRLAELNEQKRGWYHVELELTLSVYNNHGNDYRTTQTYMANGLANSAMDAYDKIVKDIKSETFTHRGNVAILESWAGPESHGYDFLFLGVKTDEGYSVELWEEWHKNGEI